MHIIIFLIVLISALVWKSMAICIIPGLVLVLLGVIQTKTLVEQLVYSIFFSFAYWIIGFSILKFIPIHLTLLLDLSLYVSLILLGILVIRRKVYFHKIQIDDVVWIALCVVMLVFFLRIFQGQIVPAGADMSTHTYIARIISDANAFPKTHEPIAPISTFGFAPYGLATMIAVMSLYTGVPIYRASLLVVSYAYPLLIMAFMLLLRRYFFLPTILLTIIYLFAFDDNLSLYIYWGGITTIVSLAFLIVGIAMQIPLLSNHKDSLLRQLAVAVVLAASFYTNQLSLVVLGIYYLILITFYIWKKNFSKARNMLYVCVWLGIFMLPFITSMQPISASENYHILNWQNNPNYFFLPENPLQIIPAFINNIIRWHNIGFLILTFISCIVASYTAPKLFRWCLVALGLLAVLIVNSHYWFLPLSQLFYPDRLLTIILIPSSLLIATFFESLWNFFLLIIKSKKKIPIAVTYIIILCIVVACSYKLHNFFFNRIIIGSRYFSSVTNDDLNAFTWLQNNTTQADIIANSYNDAGLWIPAIVGRKITLYDTNPHYIQELTNSLSTLVPTYVFIGSKSVDHNSKQAFFVDRNLDTNQKYTKVYSSGDAKVYKINK